MRRLIPTLAAISVLVGLVTLFRVAKRYDPALESDPQKDAPEVSIRLENATIISRREGQSEWSAQAARIDVHQPEFGGLDTFSAVDFHDIKNGKLFRTGKLEARFQAQGAEYDQLRGEFTIQGPMLLTTIDGDRMRADACVWSERSDEVRLTTGAQAVMRGHKLTAPYVLFSTRKRIVNCPQGGEAVFDRLTTRASNLVWDVDKGIVNCSGSVSGERTDMTFSASGARIKLIESKKSRESGSRVSFVANNGSAEIRIEGDELKSEALR